MRCPARLCRRRRASAPIIRRGIFRPRKYKEQESRAAWSAEEIAQFEAYYPIGSAPRLAFALLLYTMQRRGDVIRLGPQHIRSGELLHQAAKDRCRTHAAQIRPELPSSDRRHAMPASDIPDRRLRAAPFTGDYFSRAISRMVVTQLICRSRATLTRTYDVRGRIGWQTTARRRTSLSWGGWRACECKRYTKAADQRHNARQAIGLSRSASH